MSSPNVICKVLWLPRGSLLQHKNAAKFRTNNECMSFFTQFNNARGGQRWSSSAVSEAKRSWLRCGGCRNFDSLWQVALSNWLAYLKAQKLNFIISYFCTQSYYEKNGNCSVKILFLITNDSPLSFC